MSARTIPIVIASRGRAGHVPALVLFPTATLVVPAADEPAYRAAHPNASIVCQPATARNLAETRQWIWEQHGEVFLADDDVTDVFDLSVPPGERIKVEPSSVEAIVQRTAHLARELGVKLFGFNPFMKPLGYTEHAPFQLTGALSMHAIGLLPSELLYIRSDMSLHDDFWLSLLNAHHHRWCLMDRRYHFSHPGTMRAIGGLANVRSEHLLAAGYQKLRDAFGDVVQPQHATEEHPVWSDGMFRVRLPF